MDKLRECPFCGSPATSFRWTDHYGCSNMDCGAYPANLTADQWNRRPSPWRTGKPEKEGWYVCNVRALSAKIAPYDFPETLTWDGLTGWDKLEAETMVGTPLEVLQWMPIPPLPDKGE